MQTACSQKSGQEKSILKFPQPHTFAAEMARDGLNVRGPAVAKFIPQPWTNKNEEHFVDTPHANATNID